jgi:emp24/gp25L/p24 family/GOLD
MNRVRSLVCDKIFMLIFTEQNIMKDGIYLKKIIIIFALILLAFPMVFAPMFSSVNALTVEHILVRSGQLETLTINLLAPQTVTGSFNVSGTERNSTVDFWVRDPDGATILDAETAANGENFTFTANSDGEYVLNFKNHLAFDENVDLEYSVSSPPVRILGLDPITFSGVVIEIAVALAIVGFVIYRTHSRRRSTQSPLS